MYAYVCLSRLCGATFEHEDFQVILISNVFFKLKNV